MTLIGGSIGIIGAAVLVIAFRAFAPKQQRGSDFRPFILIGAAVAFILACCMVLLIFSRT